MASVQSLQFLALRAVRVNRMDTSHLALSTSVDSWFGAIAELSDMAHNFNGCIFGGAARDFARGMVPNDFDIAFCDRFSAAEFLDQLRENNTWKMTRNAISPTAIYETKDYVARVTLAVSRASIHIDIVCHTNLIDFDVNTLFVRWDTSHEPAYYVQTQFSDRLHLGSVLQHICDKQLIVMDREGQPSLRHNHRQRCIFRATPQGIKIAKRMASMKARGWTVLNDVCINPCCILSSDAQFEAYLKAKNRAQPRRENRAPFWAPMEDKSKREQMAEMMEASYDDEIWDAMTDIKELARK